MKDLVHLQEDQRLLKEVMRQLSKDFGACPDVLPETSSFGLKQFLVELEQQLQQFSSEQSEAFFQLLYRIDLPETKVFDWLQKGQLAEAILKRELQKVILRRRFSPK